MKRNFKNILVLIFISLLLISCHSEEEAGPTESPASDISDTTPIELDPSLDSGAKKVIIRNKAPKNSKGYSESGEWTTSSLLGYKNSISRYSGESDAQVVYTTTKLGSEKKYCVSIYRMTHPNSTDKSSVIITDNGVELLNTSVAHNRSASDKGWYHLGEFQFSGYNNEVSLTIEQAVGNNGGFLRADDIRFKRLEENTDCLGRTYATVKKKKIIDNGLLKNTNGYRESGSWINSSLVGFKGKISRYSAEQDASVTYTAKLVNSEYCVSVYKVTHPNSVTSAKITISQEGDLIDEQTLDYSLETSSAGWIQLGDYNFDKSRFVEIKIERDSSGILRADAVKFKKGLCK